MCACVEQYFLVWVFKKMFILSAATQNVDSTKIEW